MIRALGSVVERPLRKREVAGANPAESTFFSSMDYGGKPASGSGCDCGFRAESHQASGCNPKQDFALIKCELERYLPTLPKHHLVEIRKMVMQQFRKRFQRSRIPKYGSLNKGFTEQEVQRFFKVVDNEKFRLLFSYQSQLLLYLLKLAELLAWIYVQRRVAVLAYRSSCLACLTAFQAYPAYQLRHGALSLLVYNAIR